MVQNRPLRDAPLRLVALVAVLGLQACIGRTPDSPVSVGEPDDDVFAAFLPSAPYAASCDRRTYFYGDVDFERCLAQSNYRLIYRRGDFQYAYTVEDGLVADVLITNHTVTYP